MKAFKAFKMQSIRRAVEYIILRIFTGLYTYLMPEYSGLQMKKETLLTPNILGQITTFNYLWFKPTSLTLLMH